jgi:hypothetical protein
MRQNQRYIHLFFLNSAIIEFLFFSGEKHITDIFFNGGIAPLFFLITCSLCFFTNSNRGRIKKEDHYKMLFISLWTILCTYILGKGNHNSLWISYVFYALGMMLLVSSTDFYFLKEKLLKYLSLLTFISIIVQLGHDYFGLFPAKPYITEKTVRYLSLGIFNTEWGENRLSSIYWEPGQYQIIIYYVLVLFADEWCNLSNLKRNLKKFGLLLVGLIMTTSTTAYLVLMLAILVIFISNMKRKNIVVVLLLICLGVTSIYFLTISPAVQEKVEQKDSDQENSSYAIRMADNMACLEVTMDSPITGYGPGSDILGKKLYAAGSLTNSNGWLYSAAQLGIPYVLLLWLFMWRNLRRHYKANTLLLLFMLIISQSNEAFITFPYLYLYIFNGRNY